MNTRNIIKISFLGILITVFSFIKLPGIIPGTEFQISAPVSVAICAVFGFKNYILAGILSSTLTFFLGTHNLLNILNAFIFRVVSGGIIHFSNKNIFFISISGPIGSFVSRIMLSIITKANFLSLLVPSIPGMIYTLFTAYPITKIFEKLVKKEGIKNK
ncbi:MAG TPA: hypothetical protein H9923_06280 [Candidatus Dwaynia gallinarum]|nr:hypothetical protein [Candidatus Dwaynia gallinarum]